VAEHSDAPQLEHLTAHSATPLSVQPLEAFEALEVARPGEAAERRQAPMPWEA
jgi:hypothetical protein